MIGFANIDKPFLIFRPIFVFGPTEIFIVLKTYQEVPDLKYVDPLQQHLQLFCYNLKIVVLGNIILRWVPLL